MQGLLKNDLCMDLFNGDSVTFELLVSLDLEMS